MDRLGNYARTASLRRTGASFSLVSSLARRDLEISELARGRPSPSEVDEADVEMRRDGRGTAGLEGVSSFPLCKGGSVRSCDAEAFERSVANRRASVAPGSRRMRDAFSVGNGVVACDLRRFEVLTTFAEVADEDTVGAMAGLAAVEGSPY